MMRMRGFRLGNKLVKVFKWTSHGRRRRTTTTSSYQRLNQSSGNSSLLMSRISRWVRSLKQGAKGLCSSKPDPGFIRMGRDSVETKPVSGGVPKGHMAVYVGEKHEELQRYLVPVIYFNHPLLGDLLKEAEEVYGFGHPGGIQIPCRTPEFENVQRRIEAAGGGGSRRWRCFRVQSQCLAN